MIVIIPYSHHCRVGCVDLTCIQSLLKNWFAMVLDSCTNDYGVGYLKQTSNIYIYIYVYMYMSCVYIYIYTYIHICMLVLILAVHYIILYLPRIPQFLFQFPVVSLNT